MVKWRKPQQLEVNEEMKKEAVAKAFNCLLEYENGNFKNPVRDDSSVAFADEFLRTKYIDLYNETMNLLQTYFADEKAPVKMVKFKPSSEAFVDMLLMLKKKFGKSDTCKEFSFDEKGNRIKVEGFSKDEVNMQEFKPFCME